MDIKKIVPLTKDFVYVETIEEKKLLNGFCGINWASAMKPAKITAVCDLLDQKKTPESTELTIEYSDMNSTYSRTFSQISSQGKSMPRCLQILKLNYEDQKINTESQIVYAGRSNYDLALLYSDVSSWLTLSKGIVTKFDR